MIPTIEKSAISKKNTGVFGASDTWEARDTLTLKGKSLSDSFRSPGSSKSPIKKSRKKILRLIDLFESDCP